MYLQNDPIYEGVHAQLSWVGLNFASVAYTILRVSACCNQSPLCWSAD